MSKDKKTENTASGDSRDVTQADTITNNGILNLGGNNHLEGNVVGPNATVVNNGDKKKGK